MRLELHVHTVHSIDSSIGINQLSKWCSQQSKLEGIAITDHDSVEGYKQLMRSVIHEDNFLIIPGIEISYVHGHVLILNVFEKPKRPIMTVEEITDFAKDQGGIVIIAHPYRFNGLKNVAEDFPADAVEILNPTASQEENRLAKLLAESRNLPGVAGSDAHRIEDIGRVINQIEPSNSIEDVIKEIKNGNVDTCSRIFEL